MRRRLLFFPILTCPGPGAARSPADLAATFSVSGTVSGHDDIWISDATDTSSMQTPGFPVDPYLPFFICPCSADTDLTMHPPSIRIKHMGRDNLHVNIFVPQRICCHNALAFPGLVSASDEPDPDPVTKGRGMGNAGDPASPKPLIRPYLNNSAPPLKVCVRSLGKMPTSCGRSSRRS